MKGLALKTANLGSMAAMMVLAMAMAFGIAVTQPGIALAVGLGVAFLGIAFVSIEAALYILIASMLLSPEIIVGELGGRAALGRGVTLRLDDFLLIVIGLGWLAKTAIHKELGLFPKTALNRPILYYMLTVTLATGIGILGGRVDPLAGFFFTLKYFEYFFIYFMAVNSITDKTQIKRFVLVALITCFLVGLYALAQIPAGGRVTAPFEGEGGEPNTFGGYLVFMLSIVMGLFLYLRSQKERIALAGLAVIIVIALLATLSRGSYLALVMVIVVLLLRPLLERRNIVLFSALATLMLVITVAALLMARQYITSQTTLPAGLPSDLLSGAPSDILSRLPSDVRQRIESTFTQPTAPGQIEVFGQRVDLSASQRILSWIGAFQDFKARPFLGSGVTGYGFMDAQYPRILVETGVLGLVAFLYLVYTVGQQGLKAYRAATDPYEKGIAFGLIVGLSGMLVHAIGANTFILVRIMEPFWLFAAFVMVMPRLEKTKEYLPSEQSEREGEAPSGFAGGGGDVSPYDRGARR